MSELTKCNFCSLQAIRQKAREKKQRVVLRSGQGSLGGTDVYVIPRGVPLPKHIKAGTEKTEGDAFHQKYFVAWFMELTSHCFC